MDAEKITAGRFLNEFVAPGVPLIVTGSLRSWDIQNKWTPESLNGRFGARLVQVYNNYFDLQSLMPLSVYIDKYFGGSAPLGSEVIPYVRWYTKLRDVEFCWAD